MAVHASSAQSTDPADAMRSQSAELAPAQRPETALAVRVPTRRRQRSTAGVADGVRAAASVMGWALWILLALTMAAFLAFAPSLN